MSATFTQATTADATPTSISMFTTYLPDGFQPTESEVMIGRGRKILQHSGNVKLRELVQSKAKDYCKSGDKTLKSFIISEIGNRIKRESQHGGFVKKDGSNGKWYVVSDSCVRATIAQTFRDCLSPNYRSSKFSKQRRRWCQKTVTTSSSSTVTASATTNATTTTPSATIKTAAASSLPLVAGSSKQVGAALGSPATGFLPLNGMSLKTALHLPSATSMPSLVGSSSLMNDMPSLFSDCAPAASPTSVAESTSNILKRCLDVLDDTGDDLDGCEAWISYTENPFEPNPIKEESFGSGAITQIGRAHV